MFSRGTSYVQYLYPTYALVLCLCSGCTYKLYVCWLCVLGIRTDEPALFANSWAVDLPHERACPSVDLDFNGPCQSESDMDVRTETFSLLK